MSFIGQRIGRFRIEALLGSGGMGDVYQGYDEILGREVALKVAGDKQRLTPLEKTRFFREARVLSHLDHPNICRIYDLVERPQADVLVLEYIKGQTLRQEMKDGLTEKRKLEIAIDLTRVLEVAHHEEILHRDLKPDNIMINEEGLLKVLDFGLARSLHDQKLAPVQLARPGEKPPVRRTVPQNAETIAVAPMPATTENDGDDSFSSLDSSTKTTFGSIVGTLWYMSPEQAQTLQANTSCDMYSLGVILLELFSEKPAYSKKLSMPALLYKVSRAETRSLDEAAPNLDPDLATLIKQMLRLNPEQRPTASQALEKLEFIAGKPSRRRKRRTVTLVSVIAFTVVSVLGWTLYKSLAPPQFVAPDEKARLVVLPFRNKTGNTEHDWVQWGLRDLVAGYLDRAENLEAVTESNVRRATNNLQVFSDDGLRREALQQLRVSLNATVIIAASVGQVNNRFQLRYSVYNFEGAGLHRSVVADNPPKAGRFLGEDVYELLSGDRGRMTGEEFSSSDLANQLYGLGLQASVTDGPTAAVNYLRVSLDIDPDFEWARLRLAKLLEIIGQREESEALALQLYDSLDAKQATKRHFCLQTLVSLAARQTDWERYETLLDEALELAKQIDKPVVLGQTYRDAGRLAVRRRQFDQAEDYFIRARDLFDQAGSRTSLASVISDLGYVEDERNNLDQAEAYYQESIAISKEVGFKRQTTATMVNLGVIYWRREQWDLAEKTYKDTAENYEAMGVMDGVALARGNLGLIRANQEDYAGAEAMLLEAIDMYRASKNQEGIANISYNLADLYITYLDRPAEAGPFIEEALTLYGDDPDALLLKAHYLYLMENFDGALSVFDEALTLAEKEKNQAWIEANGSYRELYVKAKAAGRVLPLSQ